MSAGEKFLRCPGIQGAVAGRLIGDAVSAQQMQEGLKAQVAMLKEMAEMQQQVALMLAESGIGLNLNVMA